MGYVMTSERRCLQDSRKIQKWCRLFLSFFKNIKFKLCAHFNTILYLPRSEYSLESSPAFYTQHQVRCEKARHLRSNSALCWQKQLNELHGASSIHQCFLYPRLPSCLDSIDLCTDEPLVYCKATQKGKQLRLIKNFQFDSNTCNGL